MPSKKEDRVATVRVHRNDVDTPSEGGLIRLHLDEDRPGSVEVRLGFRENEGMNAYPIGARFRLVLEPLESLEDEDGE